MDESVLITCKKCKVRVPIKVMRYDTNAELICFDCYERQIKATKGQLAESSSVEKVIRPSQSRKVESKDTIKYYCTLCKFRFSRGKEFGFPKNCPYCSKDAVEIWRDVDASTLLRETEDMY